MIKEDFNFLTGQFTAKNGQTHRIIYIDPKTSENTFQYKDELKNKFGANWFGQYKAWGWFTNGDQNQINNLINSKVKPCIEFLQSVSSNKTDENTRKQNVINAIDKLLAAFNSNQVATVASGMSAEDVKSKLETFKQKLVNITTSEEFKEMFLPIIKFRRAQGIKFSFANAILIYLQDPKATMVKSTSRWRDANKTIKPGSPSIFMYVPVGSQTKYSKTDKDNIVRDFLRRLGKSSEAELTVGEKERLDLELHKIQNAKGFKLVNSFYDVRFTEQMEGKEDIVGSNDTSNIEWHEDGVENEETHALIDATIRVINKLGINVSKVDNLGGALGVSKSGTIDVLASAKKNRGLFSTLVHEFSHELLHQKYLSSTNENMKQYFVGTAQGRGNVEQQAEISAWIVLSNYGYESNTAINYAGAWGMDEKQAPIVFNTVLNVATYIVNSINYEMSDTMSLDENKANGFKMPSNGYELAQMLGCGDVYKRGMDKLGKPMATLNESKKNTFKMPSNGYELAKMLGCGDVYKRGLKQQKLVEMKFSTIANKALKDINDNK